ncbi:hypothetical protein [Pseudonocardia sp. H11422]|uniref:hypothetical protein n=1 Tax=Pseudonocardia sp. H11422 TaxID=2835866 RepID=UPI001BDD764F|nr:hypothetical protein [Pseudonocardia sp. H11422]
MSGEIVVRIPHNWRYTAGAYGQVRPRQQRADVVRIRVAAARALQVYPGPVGQLVARELYAYLELGWLLPHDGLAERIIRDVLDSPAPGRPAGGASAPRSP